MRNSPRKLYTEHNSTQQTTAIVDNASSVTVRSLIILAIYSEKLCLEQSTETPWRTERKFDKCHLKQKMMYNSEGFNQVLHYISYYTRIE